MELVRLLTPFQRSVCIVALECQRIGGYFKGKGVVSQVACLAFCACFISHLEGTKFMEF